MHPPTVTYRKPTWEEIQSCDRHGGHTYKLKKGTVVERDGTVTEVKTCPKCFVTLVKPRMFKE